MDDTEILRRLDRVRERVRAALAEEGPPVRLADEVPEAPHLQLGERDRAFRFPGDPTLNDTPHLRAANEAAVITGPVRLTSRVRLLGPLLTLARRLARPFVQPLIDPYLDRQERFNAEVVRHLNELGRRLEQRLDRIGREIEQFIGDPGLLEARLDAVLAEYDEALRVRHTVLFDGLEEEIVALRSLVRDAAAGLEEKLRFLEVRFVERAQAIDARFEEKDRVLESLQARASAVADAELLQTRRMLKEVLAAARTSDAGARSEANGSAPATPDWQRLARWLEDDDYRAFQHRFRGDEEEIAARLRAHLELFRGAPGPVADLGCGRGEFLELLTAAGIDALGVELNEAEVEEGRRRGLVVERADLFAWLQERPAESLGGIFMAQVIEHLPPPSWQRLVELAASRLKPGGRLLVETINPESLYALARAYVIDPTHTRPVHPQLLAFLARRAGFDPVEVRYQGEVPEGERIPPVDEEPFLEHPAVLSLVRQINQRLGRIDRLCCGPQEYALVATLPASAS